MGQGGSAPMAEAEAAGHSRFEGRIWGRSGATIDLHALRHRVAAQLDQELYLTGGDTGTQGWLVVWTTPLDTNVEALEMRCALASRCHLRLHLCRAPRARTAAAGPTHPAAPGQTCHEPHRC
jgi:hypothetical protein